MAPAFSRGPRRARAAPDPARRDRAHLRRIARDHSHESHGGHRGMTKKLLAIAVCVFASLAQVASAREPSTFELPRFGKVTVYPAASEPEEVVLFVSGDGGWNLGVVGMAQALADEGALVAGVDITRYLAALNESQASCSTPDVDFERLGHVLESKYGLKHYREPILVGYSSGATLVYGTLAQAPLGTFVGALSLGFCPDLEVKRPLCSGSDARPDPLQSGRVTSRSGQKPRLRAPTKVPSGACASVP